MEFTTSTLIWERGMMVTVLGLKQLSATMELSERVLMIWTVLSFDYKFIGNDQLK
jgi:hypothetical protein